MGERALLGGRYELGPALGSGGFATVFRARDRHSNLDVAIKLVPPGFDAPRLAEALRSEAAILKSLSSRHLARVFELGGGAEGIWLVTELIEGVPLSVEGLGRPLLPHEVLRVARGLLEGLSVAHAAGIVHADVKPANILLPRTEKALDGPKLIDFGLARAARDTRRSDEEMPASGVVVGSLRWMAPEVFAGRPPDRRSDVYSAGLVLFALLGEGDLFPSDERRGQLRARATRDPILEGRVPAPLSAVLARMLTRDPAARYQDAVEALGAVIDLDTAPVLITDDASPPSIRANQPSFAFPSPLFAPPSSRRPVPSVQPPRDVAPPSASGSLGGLASAGGAVPRASVLPRVTRTSLPPRLTALPDNGVDGLGETLRHLDLPMLDALARRERGNATGRVARAVALALRLELDAAALILEPLALSSDLARAVGTTILAPCARRVTRARVDSDREDRWLDTLPAELVALLAAFAAAISPREEAARDGQRCARALARLDREDAPVSHEVAQRIDAARTTLRIALAAARVRTGALSSGAGLDLVTPLENGNGHPFTALDRVVRPLLAAAIRARVDEGRARDDLRRAVGAANESGAPLLEVCASVAWGRLLVEVPLRGDQGFAVLQRSTMLLAHGDAPSLEHEAEHHCAVALILETRWEEAVPHLRAAREAAHAERALEAEVLSASLEVVAHVALGDHDPAREAADALGEARLGTARGRAAAFAWIAKCLEALASGEREAAEDALAEASARVREAGAEEPADAYVLVEVLTMLFDAAKGALHDVISAAAEIERSADERGFTSFYWFDVLRNVVERVDDPVVRATMHDVLARVAMLLGPASRLARERRTSAPPGMLTD